MTTKREDKALFEFKKIMENLLHLVSTSSGAHTGYLYWVNRSRKQFVKETSFTTLKNVMFKDRVEFKDFFLDDYKDIESEISLEVEKHIPRSKLKHYYEPNGINSLLLIPFQNNGETVAITVLESRDVLSGPKVEKTIAAYRSAHVNVLNTYLELIDLYEDQSQWERYDESLEIFNSTLSHVEVLDHMTCEMQKIIPSGGVVVVLRGMETWVTALRSSNSPAFPALGLMVEERSMAYDALNKGEAVFSMHFNQNPKRISSSESNTEGATIAVPLMINGRRQAVVLAYDKNPLVFTESVKHQIKNLVRTAGLTIRTSVGSFQSSEDLFATDYGNFIHDLWILSLEKQIEHQKKSSGYTWFGLIGIENLSDLRASHRLEDLNKLQRIIVKALNPSRLGFNGIIGFNSDYVYSYLMTSQSEEHHKQWLKKNISDLKNKVDMGDGRKISVSIKVGTTKIQPDDDDIDELIYDAKQALSVAMKKNQESIIIE